MAKRKSQAILEGGTFLPQVTQQNPVVAHRAGDACSLAFKGTIEQLEDLIRALQQNEIHKLEKCMIAFQGSPRQMESVVYAMHQADIQNIDVGILWKKKAAAAPAKPRAKKGE